MQSETFSPGCKIHRIRILAVSVTIRGRRRKCFRYMDYFWMIIGADFDSPPSYIGCSASVRFAVNTGISPCPIPTSLHYLPFTLLPYLPAVFLFSRFSLVCVDRLSCRDRRRTPGCLPTTPSSLLPSGDFAHLRPTQPALAHKYPVTLPLSTYGLADPPLMLAYRCARRSVRQGSAKVG